MTRKKELPGLDPADVRAIGKALAGTQWQSYIARNTGYSKSMITRVSSAVSATSRPCTPALSLALRNLIVDRIEILSKLLTAENMPGGKKMDTKRAQKLIVDALELLRDDASLQTLSKRGDARAQA